MKTGGINPGQFVNPADVLVEVVDRSDLHLQVFEHDIARVQLGQPILFTVPARGTSGPVLRARVFLVGKAFDDDARTVAVHAHLEGNDTDNLLPGQYVAARIQTVRSGSPEFHLQPRYSPDSISCGFLLHSLIASRLRARGSPGPPAAAAADAGRPVRQTPGRRGSRRLGRLSSFLI